MNTLKMVRVNAVKDGVTTIAEMVKATYEAEEDDSRPKAKRYISFFWNISFFRSRRN